MKNCFANQIANKRVSFIGLAFGFWAWNHRSCGSLLWCQASVFFKLLARPWKHLAATSLPVVLLVHAMIKPVAIALSAASRHSCLVVQESSIGYQCDGCPDVLHIQQEAILKFNLQHLLLIHVLIWADLLWFYYWKYPQSPDASSLLWPTKYLSCSVKLRLQPLAL